MADHKRPTLDQLRTFLVVYRGGSFSDAARQLAVSQPTVTNHIGVLERWFGKSLFTRNASGVEPTLQAHELASELADPLDRIDRFFAGEQSELAVLRTVSVGGPREFITLCVLPALRQDAGRMPNLDFRFGQSKTLLEELEAGRIDFVISTIRPRNPEVVAWPLADEEFWLVAAPERAVSTDSLAALSAAPMVAFNGELAIIRRYWNTVFGAEPKFDPAVVLPDLMAVKTAVVHGLGITVLPSYLVRDEVSDGRLVKLMGDEESMINTVFLAAQKPALESRKHINGMARLLVGRIKEFQAAQERAFTLQEPADKAANVSQ